MIKKSTFAKFAAGFLALASILVASSAHAYTFTTTLKQGVKGTAVMELQKVLNMNAATMVATSGAGSIGHETTTFGPATKAAVMKFQTWKGLGADGIVGAMTRAALNNTSTTGLPAGCTSTSGFSSTTGFPCNTGTPTNLPAGCMSTAGFSTVNGMPCNTNVGTTTGPVMAMLATDNPAASTLVAGQATADLAHFTFSGTGTVTGVQLQRTGVSANDTLTNVYLYEGSARLTDAASVTTNGMITFSNPSGLFMVSGGTKTISVRADIKAATNGQTVGVMLNNFSVAGQTSATTSTVSGNLMAIASATDLATAVIGTNTIASPNVDPGTSNYTVWSAPLNIGNRSVWFKGATFKVIGSAPAEAFTNVRLVIDGAQVGTATTLNSMGNVSFDTSAAPIALATGSHTVEVRADVVAGSSRTFYVSLQNAGDLMVTDSQYNVNVALASGTVGTLFTMNNSGTVTINSGTLSLTTDPTFNATTLTASASNQTIGKFQLRSYGEGLKIMQVQVNPVFTSVTHAFTVTATATTAGSSTTFNTTGSKTLIVSSTTGLTVGDVITVEDGATDVVATITAINSATSLTVNVTTAGSTATLVNGSAITGTAHTVASGASSLQNVGLYLNGAQVGTSQNAVNGTALTFNLGSSLIVPAGQAVTLEVRADLTDSSGRVYTGGTVATTVTIPASQAQGTSSYTLYPVSAINATDNAMTFGAASVVVAKSSGFQDSTIASNMASQKIGSFVIQAGSNEGVRVTNLAIALSGSLGTTNLSNLKVSYNGVTSTPVNPQANNNFSTDFTVPMNSTWTVDVWADAGNSTGTVVTTLTVTARGASSNTSITGTAVTGQTITVGNGTLGTTTLVASSSTPAQYLAVGTTTGLTNGSKGTYNLVSSGGAVTVTKLVFTVTASAGTPVTTVTVNGVTSPVVSGTATLNGLSIAVPNGSGGINIDAFVSYGPIVSGGSVTSATTAILTLASLEYLSGGTSTTATPAVAAPTITVVGSKPVVTINSTQQTGLILGAENKIGEVTITADAAGNIAVNQLIFTVGGSGLSAAVDINDTTPVLRVGGALATGVTCAAGAATGPITCTFTSPGYTVAPGSPVTFSLYATVNNSAVSGATASISTALTTAGFLWTDVAGNGSVGARDGAFVWNFPTGSYSIRQ